MVPYYYQEVRDRVSSDSVLASKMTKIKEDYRLFTNGDIDSDYWGYVLSKQGKDRYEFGVSSVDILIEFLECPFCSN
jgi:hypothetical protein